MQKLNQVARVLNVDHGDLITGELSCYIQDISHPLTVSALIVRRLDSPKTHISVRKIF